MSVVPSSAALDAARRTRCWVVNFGVVAVARVTGVADDQLLELRCECGAAGRCERIQITRGEYEAVTDANTFVVSSLHASDAAEAGDGRFAVTQDHR